MPTATATDLTAEHAEDAENGVNQGNGERQQGLTQSRQGAKNGGYWVTATARCRAATARERVHCGTRNAECGLKSNE